MSVPIPLDGAGCVVLDRDQCLAYLAGGGLGRVGVNVGALPAVLPVRFALDGEHVVFSVGAGTVLDRATRDAVVAFESDGHDGGGQWSVSITGMARHRTAGDRPVVAVSTEHISGRRDVGPWRRVVGAPIVGP